MISIPLLKQYIGDTRKIRDVTRIISKYAEISHVINLYTLPQECIEELFNFIKPIHDKLCQGYKAYTPPPPRPEVPFKVSQIESTEEEVKKISFTPVQLLVRKRVRECTKQINKHKRVFVEKNYGNTKDTDNMDDSDCGVVDDDITDAQLGIEVPEKEVFDESEVDEEEEVEEDIDAEEEVINEDDYEENINIADDEDDIKIDFGTSTVKDRFIYYSTILNGIDFGNLSNLGL